MSHKKGFLMAVALASVCAAPGCNRQARDEQAIRASIDKRLNGRADLNMSVMDREVKQITVKGDHAKADVEFRLKGGDARMEIEYMLDRQGGDWNIISTQPVSNGQENHPGTDGPFAPSSEPGSESNPNSAP